LKSDYICLENFFLRKGKILVLKKLNESVFDSLDVNRGCFVLYEAISFDLTDFLQSDVPTTTAQKITQQR